MQQRVGVGDGDHHAVERDAAACPIRPCWCAPPSEIGGLALDLVGQPLRMKGRQDVQEDGREFALELGGGAAREIVAFFHRQHDDHLIAGDAALGKTAQSRLQDGDRLVIAGDQDHVANDFAALGRPVDLFPFADAAVGGEGGGGGNRHAQGGVDGDAHGEVEDRDRNQQHAGAQQQQDQPRDEAGDAIEHSASGLGVHLRAYLCGCRVVGRWQHFKRHPLLLIHCAAPAPRRLYTKRAGSHGHFYATITA